MQQLRRKPVKSARLISQLRTSRQKQGLSLEEIAEHSKISMFFLKAIEAGEFEKLPGGIYDLCYLRQYAAETGFPESELIAFYHSSNRPKFEPEPAQAGSRIGRLASRLTRWLRSGQ